jgi:hypothetical protein
MDRMDPLTIKLPGCETGLYYYGYERKGNTKGVPKEGQ